MNRTPRPLSAEERKRSRAQNRLLWSRLTDLSEQVRWYGMDLSPEDYKHLLTAALHSERVVPGVNGGYVVLGQSTSRMSVAEMQDLLMLIEVFGNERGVVWTIDEFPYCDPDYQQDDGQVDYSDSGNDSEIAQEPVKFAA